MADGSIIIDTTLDNKELQKQISNLDKIIDKGMKGCLVSIGAIATAITGLGASAINFGTEYQKHQINFNLLLEQRQRKWKT